MLFRSVFLPKGKKERERRGESLQKSRSEAQLEGFDFYLPGFGGRLGKFITR